MDPAERLVEIDRLLATPLTGNPDEATQRSLLRAERESLIASGQVPNISRPVHSNPTTNTRSAQFAQRRAVTHRSANGDVLNYAPESAAPASRIYVAPNSQATNLSFLEQMTPTERQRYYRDLAIRNRGRYEVDVYHQ